MRKISAEIALHRSLKNEQRHEPSSTLANIIGDAIFPAIFCSLASLIPFMIIQWYGYTIFCGLTKMNLNFDQVVIDYANNHSLKLPSHEPSPWCFSMVPMAYSYIQSHYWNVGFLKYFHWKQIPNFFLAAPMLFFTLNQSWRFFCHHKSHCLKLGLGSAGDKTNFDTYGKGILPKECFVYVVHIAFLSLFALFFIHVQVATRLIASSSPVVYWWIAILTIPRDKKPPHMACSDIPKNPRPDICANLEPAENHESLWKNLVFDERPKMNILGVWLTNYCVAYACIGTVLFVNFLPWT